MKTFKLKFISILIPALTIATAVNAEIMLSVNGDTTVNEISIPACTTFWVDIYSTDSEPYSCWVGIVDAQGNTSTCGEWTGAYAVYFPPGCIPPIEPEPPSDGWWFFEYPYCGPQYPPQPGKHAELEYHCKVPACDCYIKLWDGNLEFVLDTIVVHQAAPDLGDAPDSTNNYGVPMTAYPGSGVQANYPTVYNDGNNLNPRGPIHKQPSAVAYLGEGVSGEFEADSGWDEDPNNNIEPQADMPDEDGADDCIPEGLILLLNHQPGQVFGYKVTVVTPNVPLYANVWFDWNQDGDWNDLLDFCGHAAPEWAVQNQELLFSEAGLHTVVSSPFMPWSSLESNQYSIWMRITLSEQPWTGSGSGGSGPVGGYQYGETEDHLLQVLFPLYCFPTDHPDFCEWLDVGSPGCWCYPRQCHGDADDAKEGTSKTGYSYVRFNDLGLLLSAWYIKQPPFGPGIAWPDPEICADFAHDEEGSPKSPQYRVHFNDLRILLTNWSIKEPPHGSGIEPNCLDVP